MSDIVTAQHSAAPIAPQTKKKERISRRMQKVLTDLATKGMTQREAARRAGMSESHLSTALRKPEIQMFIARKARETIGVASLRASHRVAELIDASSEHVSLDASKHVLAIEGIRPHEQGVSVGGTTINVGYIVNLAPNANVGHGVGNRHELEIKPNDINDIDT